MDPIRGKIRELERMEARFYHLKNHVKEAEYFLDGLGKQINRTMLDVSYNAGYQDDWPEHIGTCIPFTREVYDVVVAGVKTNIEAWKKEMNQIISAMDKWKVL